MHSLPKPNPAPEHGTDPTPAQAPLRVIPPTDPPPLSPTGATAPLRVEVEVRWVPADQEPELAAEQLAAITEVLTWLTNHPPNPDPRADDATT